MESTKGIEIKLGTYIDFNERKCRRRVPYSYLTFYLSYLSLFFSIKCGSLNSVMYWCTNGVWLQVLPFIDNSHVEHSLLPAILLVFQYYHYHNYYYYYNYYNYYHYYYVKTIHAISIYFSTGIIKCFFFLCPKKNKFK